MFKITFNLLPLALLHSFKLFLLFTSWVPFCNKSTEWNTRK